MKQRRGKNDRGGKGRTRRGSRKVKKKNVGRRGINGREKWEEEKRK